MPNNGCPPQKDESDEVYCNLHANCCDWTIRLEPDTSTFPPTTIRVRQGKPNSGRELQGTIGIDQIWDVIPPERFVARGVFSKLDPVTVDRYRAEYDTIAAQYAGDLVAQAHALATFCADHGLLLHQQAILANLSDSESAIQRTELLHTMGFHGAALISSNTLIHQLGSPSNTIDRQQIIATNEIKARSLQALGRSAEAQDAFLTVAELRLELR